METIWQLLKESADRHGERAALVIRRGYRAECWTYLQLRQFSARVANFLLAEGLRPGDRVLVWSPNMPEWVGLYFGCALAGVVIVPLDVRIQPDFVRRIQTTAGASAIFVSGGLLEKLPALGIRSYVLEDLQDAARNAPAEEPPAPTPETLAEVMFTSGTTGEPKGVMLTHRNIVSNVRSATTAVPGKSSYRLLSILPLSHMFEQNVGLLAPISSGAMIVYPQSLQPGLIFRNLQEYRITTIVAVPQVLRLFWDGIEREVEKQGKTRRWDRALKVARWLPMAGRRLLFRQVHKRLGGSLRFVMCGGAYLDPELGRQWELLGIEVLQGYGTTEASPAISTNRHSGRKVSSCGKPLPGVEARIAEDGEILVRGPNVTSGYWHDEKATAAAFDGDWYRTGDIGHFDSDGHLHLSGRKKDMIVLDTGMNVYPQDIEVVLNSDPRVKDCCVVGFSAPSGRIQVHAVLLLHDPNQGPRAIVETANSVLNDHQRIRGFTVWPREDFPRTHTLKIRKRDVVHVLRSMEKRPGAPRSREADAAVPEAPSDGSSAGGASRPQAGVSGPEPSSRRGAVSVYTIAASVADIRSSALRPQMRLEDDLHLDSLGRVELLSAIEAELGVYIDESSIRASTTLGEIGELLGAATGQRGRPEFPVWPLNPAVRLAGTMVQGAVALPTLRLLAPITIAGADRIAGLSGPVILAANHESHLDTPAVLAALPGRLRRRTAVAAAADFWFGGRKLPGAAVAFLFNAFPFSRSGAVRPTLEHCARLVESGWSILVFPEGTRSADGLPGRFKAGAGLIAVELGVPVVPVFIDGTFEVLSRDERWPRRGPVHVTFGSPLTFGRDTAYSEATQAIQEAVFGLGSASNGANQQDRRAA
ncbi:MAG: AMP-binding protein [Chloroflexi bacterium]|nr:AMP-binding protein [Chloroflexota bacterium]